MTPFQASTHADPYPYYATLRQENGLAFNSDLGLWVASSAKAVDAILRHPDCHVRPLHEPVPAAIAGDVAGAVFARLMRMNEGPQHLCPRRAIEPALASIETKDIKAIVSQVIETVENLNELMFTVPVAVVAALIGVPTSRLQDTAWLTREFVACLSPLSDATQLAGASSAATRLRRLFALLLKNDDVGSRLLSHIRDSCASTGWNDEDGLSANLIGLLSQTCEASAGLIGNTLIALHRNPALLEGMAPGPSLIADLLAETARHDSPVQNTRRFVAKRCAIGDSVLQAGDSILVLLASANRDPWANPDPHSFLLERAQRRTFSFGSGRHECPGQRLALAIASEAIQAWLYRNPSPAPRLGQWTYLPSLNGRIPQFNIGQARQP